MNMAMDRTCSFVFDEKAQSYCRCEATTFVSHEGGGRVYYCAEHAERAAQVGAPMDAARVEAETRAHDRVSPESRLSALGAVNLYVEAFVAGARFAAKRVEVTR